MDTMSAFMMAQANKGNEKKIFDWNKAAQIIKQRKATYAVAGLSRDLEWTAGTILEDGKPVDDNYTYLASIWATPVLVFYHFDDPDWEDEDPTEEVPCYIMEHETKWDANTKWPLSALAILNAQD